MSAFSGIGEPDLGYCFVPRESPQLVGYRRLEVTIFKTPTDQHFDPEAVQLLIFSRPDEPYPQRIEHLELYHPWPLRTSYQLAPGILTIPDRKGKKVKAFSFGGIVHIESQDESTKCIIESDAPIIEIVSTESTVMKLVEEIEILLAKQRAIWREHEEKFEEKLANIPPSQLYPACIEELLLRFENDQNREMAAIDDLYEFIAAEKEALREAGLWPEEVPSISELL